MRSLERVAVLYNIDYLAKGQGAPSYEADAEIREIAEIVASILDRAGHRVHLCTVDDHTGELIAELERLEAEAVFNLVESLGGEVAREAEIPRLLAAAGLRFTGNREATLRLSHAKDEARRVLAARGVPVPRGAVVWPGRGEDLNAVLAVEGLTYPVFVKPARTDASVGIDQASLARSEPALRAKLADLEALVPGPYLVEEYLPGREINVAIFPEPTSGRLVPTEIDFSGCAPDLAPIVTYDCKWRPGTPDYAARSVPARGRLSDAELADAQAIARAAFLALGGTSYGRVDLRQGADHRFRVIDVNPNPDLHPEAGLAIAAASVGVGHEAVILEIMDEARRSSSSPASAPGPGERRRAS